MHAYAVGQPYSPARSVWPETSHLRFWAGGAELALFMRGPSAAEIQAVRAGRTEYVWIDSDTAGVLAYRCVPGLPWQDTPYTPHLDATYTPPTSRGHLLVHIVLVDAASGIIRAMRQVSWPPEFAAAVMATVTRLADAPTAPSAHHAAVDALYTRYPTTDLLIARRGDTRCVGGTDLVAPGAGPDSNPRAKT